MSDREVHNHGIERYHQMNVDGDREAQLKQIYADWAATYDHDNDHKLGTVSQHSCVSLLNKHLANSGAKILDMGCGTGLVGMHLIDAGYTNFDGTDLSTEMLELARTRGYRMLFQADAQQGLPVTDNVYDAALCVGVFTHGHAGPEVLAELIRVTKPRGLVVFTVNEGVWQTNGYDVAIEKLAASGVWSILEKSKQPYMVNEGVEAWYLAARVLP